MNKEHLEKIISGLKGTSEIIHFEEGLPIVFLFDENHDNPNNSIAQNIDNAYYLIEHANIQIIGVESLARGRKWNKKNDSYIFDYPDDATIGRWDQEWIDKYKNTCTLFLQAISLDVNEELIIGVDSFYIQEKIFEVQTQEEINRLHIKRSEHFIRTTSEEYQSRQLSGNIIINCGLNHNIHIQEWIENEEINEMVDLRASYVRLNTIP